jgi:hypothetical protein
LNLVFTPTSKWNIVNSTAFYNARTQGDDTFAQLSPGAPTQLITYNYLDVRTISNDTTLNYQWMKAVGLFAAYHYSDRYIDSTENVNGVLVPAQQTDILNATNFGVRLRPAQALTVQLSGEIGRSNRPFTPVAPRHYNAMNGRLQYRTRNFQALATPTRITRTIPCCYPPSLRTRAATRLTDRGRRAPGFPSTPAIPKCT